MDINSILQIMFTLKFIESIFVYRFFIGSLPLLLFFIIYQFCKHMSKQSLEINWVRISIPISISFLVSFLINFEPHLKSATNLFVIDLIILFLCIYSIESLPSRRDDMKKIKELEAKLKKTAEYQAVKTKIMSKVSARKDDRLYKEVEFIFEEFSREKNGGND